MAIDVEDDGTVHIASPDGLLAQKAIDIIKGLTAEAEVGEFYMGQVKRLAEFGAFVEILPGTDGLVHISELDEKRVRQVERHLQGRRRDAGEGHRRRSCHGQDSFVAPRSARQDAGRRAQLPHSVDVVPAGRFSPQRHEESRGRMGRGRIFDLTPFPLRASSASTAPFCSHQAWSLTRWRRCSSVEYVEYSPSSRPAIARNPRAICRHYVAVEALGPLHSVGGGLLFRSLQVVRGLGRLLDFPLPLLFGDQRFVHAGAPLRCVFVLGNRRRRSR